MKQDLQFKYDHLFEDGWRPPLQSRNDLMSWTCNQYVNHLKRLDIEQIVDCEDPVRLVNKFGPQYDPVRANLGYVKGLYRE